MGKNIQRMVEAGALDPNAANDLNDEVIAKVEGMSADEIDTIIKFKLEVSGNAPWEPERDGSIF